MLTVKNLSKSYGKKAILKSIDLTVPNSTCIGIIGKNGSGKSTFLSILSGLFTCDVGSCFWDETDLFKNQKLRTEILGYVPQKLALFEELSALDNLKLWHSGNKKEFIEKLESGSLKFLEITDFIDKKVSQLSGGMKKRLSIACSVLEKPKLLILDEPTSSLDILCKAQIRNYIDAYRKEGGSILIVTHDIDEILLCDKTFMLSNGILTPYSFDGKSSTLEKDLQK